MRRVNELVIGEATEEDDEDLDKPILWTEAHQYVPELMLLVASPPGTERRPVESRHEQELEGSLTDGGESVAVSLVMISVPIEYRIKDIQAYLYTYEDPLKVMEGEAYRYLSDFAASVDLDSLMGPRREAFNRDIMEHIQTRLDELGVGIEIVFAGIRGAHPPAEGKVAHAFQSVISARTNMAALTNSAEEQELRTLTSVAGTKARADELDRVIQARDALRADPEADPKALAESERRVEALLTGDPAEQISALSGEAAALIAQAKAEAARRISEAASKVRTFSAEVAAYEAAPLLFKQRKVIGIYEELDDIRKFLITGNTDNVIIEYETREQGGLDRVLREKTEE